jgi:hypothetical protein
VHRGIAYLGKLEGERHLILLTEQRAGVGVMASGPSRMTLTAADARVSLRVVQTGGFGDKQSILPPDLVLDTHVRWDSREKSASRPPSRSRRTEAAAPAKPRPAREGCRSSTRSPASRLRGSLTRSASIISSDTRPRMRDGTVDTDGSRCD